MESKRHHRRLVNIGQSSGTCRREGDHRSHVTAWQSPRCATWRTASPRVTYCARGTGQGLCQEGIQRTLQKPLNKMRHTQKPGKIPSKTPAGVSSICNMEISLLNTSYSSPFYQWKQGKGLCLHKETRRDCLVQLCTPRNLAIIFFLLNRQQRSAVIYPPPSMAHKELPSFANSFPSAKGFPTKHPARAGVRAHLGCVSAHLITTLPSNRAVTSMMGAEDDPPRHHRATPIPREGWERTEMLQDQLWQGDGQRHLSFLGS